MQERTKKTLHAMTLASFGLWVAFGIFIIATNARAADMFQDVENATNAWAFVTNGDSESCAAGSTNTARQFAPLEDGDFVDKIAFRVNNSSGTACTSVSGMTGQVKYCPGDTATCDNTELLTENCTQITTSVAGSSTVWFEFECANTTLMRRVVLVGWSAGTGTNCTNTKGRYATGNPFVGTTCYGALDTSTDRTFRVYAYSPPGPQISDLVVTPWANGANFEWITDVAADSTVYWGLSETYSNSVQDTDEVTEHSLDSNLLVPGTTYHFKVCSDDGTVENCTDDDTFETDEPPVTPPSSVTTTLFRPRQGAFVKHELINALGACPPGEPPVDGTCAWYWLVLTNVQGSLSTPSDTAAVQWEVYDDADALLCSDGESMNVSGVNKGALLQPFVSGCSEFTEGEAYRWRARARYGTEASYGPWSEARFTVVADDFDPGEGWEDEYGYFYQFESPGPDTEPDFCAGTNILTLFLCSMRDAAEWLVYPNSGSRTYLSSGITIFRSGGSVAFLSDAAAVTEGTAEHCPLPTFTASFFGNSGLGTPPSFDLCEAIEERAADLNEVDGYQAAVGSIFAVIGLFIGIRLFRLFVEG